MTAYPDERTQAQAIKANVVGYLIKPFAADDLLGLVCRAVQSHDSGDGPRAARGASLPPK
jgi:DNA-binding NtrC family response regulator